MPIIIKKGTNASLFTLENGKKLLIEVNNVLNHVSDEDYEMLMRKYGAFLSERILSDKNPNGCFIVQNKKEDAKAQAKEVENDIPKDASAPMTKEEADEAVEQIEIATEALITEKPIEQVAEEKKKRGRKNKKV